MTNSIIFPPGKPDIDIKVGNTGKPDIDVKVGNTGILDINMGRCGGSSKVLYDSTEHWNAHSSMIGKKGYIYIYSDYQTDPSGNYIPGLKVGDGKAYLIDTPFINGSYSGANIICGDTEYWNEHGSEMSVEGYIYVYTDHQIISGIPVPGLKIGTGNAYIVDLPFIDAAYMDHIANSEIHITQAEREFWNNKITCYIDPSKEDKIILTKE